MKKWKVLIVMTKKNKRTIDDCDKWVWAMFGSRDEIFLNDSHFLLL
jgi:hypothetical protein